MEHLSNNNHNKTEFDWDDINVGDYHLDHSQNFFGASANKENDKWDNIVLNLKNTSSQRESVCKQKSCPSAIFETVSKSQSIATLYIEPTHDIVTNDASIALSSLIAQDNNGTCLGNAESPPRLKGDNSNEIGVKLKREMYVLNWVDNASPEKFCMDSDGLGRNNIQMENANLIEKNYENSKPKLKLNWTPASNSMDNDDIVVGAGGIGTTIAPPRAYEYKNVYLEKRLTAMRQREEEERKARQFHSRPMPNFKALHKRLDDIIVVHKITVPVTPETIKHSYVDLERRKLSEQQQRSIEIGPHPRGCPNEIKPFQLRADQRVRERREYDATVQCNLALKKLQLDEQRKKQELDENKELRKMTEFRARPNPFK